MKKIIEQLERNFYDSLAGEMLNKEVVFNGGCIWIDDYNERDNTFTVCVFHKNRNESSNVENYLASELSARIDIADAIYEKEQEDKQAMEDEMETQRVICQTNGWSW